MKKPVLVLLHGFLGSQHDWADLIHRLPDVTCIPIDLPGHGACQELPLPPFLQLTDWLYEQLKIRHIKQFHLLGYSLGGRIAMTFASTQPNGLQSLIIENAHPGLTDTAQKQQRCQHDARWAKRFYRESIHQVLHDWYQQPVFADLTEPERNQLIQQRSQNHPTVLAKTLCRYSLARQPDCRDWIKNTTTPVLYLCGTQDSKFQAVGRSLAASNQALQLTLLPGGHNLHRATPDEMANTIRHWLNTHSGH